MKHVQALFLDLDETLLDGSHILESIIRTCGQIATSHPGLDASQLVEANSEVWRVYWPEIEHKWMLGTLDSETISREAWRRALRACGCTDETVAHHAAETHRQAGREAYRLFEDVRALFVAAERARIPLALITNGASDTQRDKLRALDIEPCFAAVIISGEVGVAKPDASIFGFALEQLAVQPKNVWHVGDNIMADVAGAKGAGLTAVWLNRSGTSRRAGDPEPDVEVRSLSALRSLLFD